MSEEPGNKVITSAEELGEALQRAADIMDAEPGSPEEAELERLSIQIEKYEEENWPF